MFLLSLGTAVVLYFVHFREHIKTKHQGVRYACKLCDYTATQRAALNEHMKTVHSDIRNELQCDKCDFNTTTYRSLNVHISVAHRQEESGDKKPYHMKKPYSGYNRERERESGKLDHLDKLYSYVTEKEDLFVSY